MAEVQPEAEAAAAETVAAEAEVVQNAERSDVEMTDENREMLSGLLGSEEEKSEEPSSADALKPAMRKRRSSARSRRLSSVHGENADKELIDGMDLNDLIQKNNGADVDLLFYFKGKLMPQNTCFYEIYQLAQKDRKKQLVKPQDMPKYDRSNPASLFNHLMASMRRGEQVPEEEKITIYFRLEDRAATTAQ